MAPILCEVHRLVVMETVFAGTESPQVLEFAQRFWHVAFHAEPDIAESLIVGREIMYFSWFYRKFAYNSTAFAKADIDEYMRWYTTVGATRSALEYYRNGQQNTAWNSENKKLKLEMPVLAIGGEHCLGSNVEVMMREFASNVSGCVIRDSGHWIAEEQPEELMRQLLTFFGETASLNAGAEH